MTKKKKRNSRAKSAAGVEPISAACPDAICVADFELLAKAKMPAMAWEYVTAGAGDEITVRWNQEAFQRIRLKPRVLVDVSKLDTRVTLFGEEHAFPILLAPTAAQKLMHADGELATARGAGATGTAMVLSCFAGTSLEDVAAVAKSPLWFQLYVQPDHGFTRALVQRAEAAGYRALCLTVDTPITGARNRETRAAVKQPPMPNLKGFAGADGGDRLHTGSLEVFSSVLDAALSWKDVEWLRSVSKIPLVLKGVMNPDDADCAAKSGVAGIIVSNHGGRNLDTLPPTIEALPQVVDKVAGRMPVFVDGGIRRGTDVLKALALGANAVLIGRPYLYGLGAAGEAGVTQVIRILQREFQMAMALTGRTNVASIDRSVIWT
ncbi:MAG TPA: alpha-hydroxy acid oxidase [Candidatus Acidoferrales bacterium]|nr:alpha-hydroxy acid oxidase [Candidatus Acidoferrales bacterium]